MVGSPGRGVLLVRGPSGSGKTFGYLLETLRRIQIRGDIVEKLRHHRYPIPIPFLSPRDHPLESADRLEFVSLLQTFNRNDTVGSVLGADERLWLEWRRNRQRFCPMCRGPISSLPSLSRILAHAQRVAHSEVLIYLVRGLPEIETRPRVFFQHRPVGDSEIEYFVDRVIRSQPSSERRFEDALRAALEPGDGRIELRFQSSDGEITTRHYSRSPRCEQCGEEYGQITRDAFALRLVDVGSSEDGDLFGKWVGNDAARATVLHSNIGGLSLEELLSSPLGDFPEHLALLPGLRRMALSLGLQRATLLRPVESLSTTEQLRLLLLKALLALDPGTPLVVDGILGAFLEDQRAAIVDIVSNRSSDSLVVIIDPDGVATQEVSVEGPVLTDSTREPAIPPETLEAPYDVDSIATLVASPGPAIVVVAGPAASGKSLVIEKALRGSRAEIAKEVTTWSWFHPFAPRPSATVAEFLGVHEPLFALLAESEGARMEGIRASELSRRSRAGLKHFCRRCSGIGTVFENCFGLRYGEECSSCGGNPVPERLERPTFRGLSWPALARLSIDEAARLTRGVARVSGPLQRLQDARCRRPSLGTPLSCLSQREWHVCSLVKTVINLPRHGLAHLDRPFAGLDVEQRDALLGVIETACLESESVIVIEELSPKVGVTRRGLERNTI